MSSALAVLGGGRFFSRGSAFDFGRQDGQLGSGNCAEKGQGEPI